MKFKKLLLALIALIFIVNLFQNITFKVSRYTIQNDKIPPSFSGFKILQLADLHSAEFGHDNKYLLNRILKIDPDIILVTGDMMNSSDDDGNLFISLIQNLDGAYPVYFVCGNHELLVSEYEPTVYEQYISRLNELGVLILDDESIVIEKNGEKIDLYGYRSALRYYGNRAGLKAAGKDLTVEIMRMKLGAPEASVFSILLAHDPIYTDIYAEWGADVVLSGHVHGGVVRLPFFGGVLSPDGSFFPEYDRGRFRIGTTDLLISAGLGNSVIPFRIFDRPEIVLLMLNP